MPRQKNTVCPICFEGRLLRRSKRISDTYKGNVITYLQPGDWCDHCEEGVLSGEDAQATEKRLVEWRAKVDRREAQELARIRKRLRMTQAEAARIAGGGKNAFSRYEKGHARPVMAVSVLFKLLDRHPELVREVKEFAAV
ncbi:MAG: Antitoxin MqsA [Rhodocyclaceae bacterium]|nr:type II toxin-antitoxin system MqsA family antitoxin [Zoogloeaceae bacterium]MBV6409077.1 Antitoxin MqsA [Rhodocyclaceae bacterium]CAG0928519.1 Antitoxin MqsA [Rhodocyclaceae bacterium]